MKLLNIYSEYDVKLTVCFFAGIFCETVLKCVMFFQVYHMKLSCCYSKRSISLCFQMPQPRLIQVKKLITMEKFG